MVETNRRRFLGVAGVASVAGLTGCLGNFGSGATENNGTEGGTGAASDQLPDSMTNWAWTGPSIKTARKEQTKRFEKTTGTTVNWQTFPFKNYTAKFTSAFQGGDVPDVTALSALWIPRYAAQGAILDLAENGFSADKYVAGGKRNVVTNGSTYSVPWYVDCRALGINKAMFKEAGLEIPDPLERPSWDKWKSWVDALAKKHGTGYGMPAGEGLDGFILSNGGRYINDDGTNALINNDPAIEAAEFLQPLALDGKIETFTSNTGTESVAQFEAGEIPMYYAGSWEYGRLQETDLDWQYVPYPSGPRVDKSHTWSAGVYYSVPSSDGVKKKAGLRFLEHIASADTQKRVVRTVGGFPGLAKAYEAESYRTYIEEHPKLKTIEQEISNTVAFPDHPEVSTMWSETHKSAQSIWSGTSPKKALDKAAQEIKNVL